MSTWRQNPVHAWAALNVQAKREALMRPALRAAPHVYAAVQSIVDTVRTSGDSAVHAFNREFDGAAMRSAGLAVLPKTMKAAWEGMPAPQQQAFKRAAANIRKFHEAQIPGAIDMEIMPGQRCQRRWHALGRVGLYVPGGSAPLPSTLLMLAIPARIAGCKEIVVCTPPARGGQSPACAESIMAVAAMLGIQKLYTVGGAQAIAAMAFGTQSIPKVDKIFGPGNAYVTAAKAICAEGPDGAAMDLPAGPSEVMVVADGSSIVDFAAADLLSQAEHGPDAHVVLVTRGAEVGAAILNAVETQLPGLSRRRIAEKALGHMSVVTYTTIDEAVDIANEYAPEHLILHGRAELNDTLVRRVTTAGSIFVGPWTPESVGDYASGTNHVLPTYGFGRAYSGLGVQDFMRATTIQELSKEAMINLAPTVELLASLEGLDGHAEAVAIRRRYDESRADHMQAEPGSMKGRTSNEGASSS